MRLTQLHPLLRLSLRCNGVRQEATDQAFSVVPREQRCDNLNATLNIATCFRKVSIKEEGMVTLQFNKGNGLLPAIVQDYDTKEVLMLAYINDLAWKKSLETGKAHYWSRSRNKLWLKGETSGHQQIIKNILVDCDEDTIIYQVEQLGGAACHTGHRSCFFRQVSDDNLEIIDEPVFDPGEVYKK